LKPSIYIDNIKAKMIDAAQIWLICRIREDE